MHCKPCNTRLPEGQLVCPNCGRGVAGSSDISSSVHASRVGKGRRDKLLSISRSRSQEDDELDLELDGEISAPEPRGKSKARKQNAAPPPKPRRRRAPQEIELVDREPSEPEFALESSRIGSILADQPDLLEPGLRLYVDRSGTLGVDFPTDVGDIDFLATDRRGNFVIVLVVDRDQSALDLVSQALTLIGWVVKHLGKGKKTARAILLLGSVPDDLSYAVTAVADRVALKTYQFELSFYDVEV